MRNSGDLFMDAPPHTDLQDLVNQSYDKVFWKSLIPSHPTNLTHDLILYVDLLCFDWIPGHFKFIS